MSVLGGWNIFAGESRYVLDPPPLSIGEPKPWIFFRTNVIMRVSWGGAIGPLTRIGVGGTDTPKRYWGLIQRPGISQAYQEIGHIPCMSNIHHAQPCSMRMVLSRQVYIHPPTHVKLCRTLQQRGACVLALCLRPLCT